MDIYSNKNQKWFLDGKIVGIRKLKYIISFDKGRKRKEIKKHRADIAKLLRKHVVMT